jgi:hypothetical protein
MFSRVVTLFTMDTSPVTIEEGVLSVWVHVKGRSGQAYDAISASFAFRFNKSAPTETNLHKLTKKKHS